MTLDRFLFGSEFSWFIFPFLAAIPAIVSAASTAGGMVSDIAGGIGGLMGSKPFDQEEFNNDQAIIAKAIVDRGTFKGMSEAEQAKFMNLWKGLNVPESTLKAACAQSQYESIKKLYPTSVIDTITNGGNGNYIVYIVVAVLAFFGFKMMKK